MSENNQMDTAQAEKLQQKAAYKEALLEEFEDPAERKLYERQLDDTFDLGLVEESTPADAATVEKNTDELEKKAQAELEKPAEEAKPVEEAKADEPEVEPEQKADEGEAEPEEEPEWKKAIEEMKAEIAKRDIKITELEAKNTLNDADKDIRDEVSRTMAATLQAQKVQDTEMQAKLEKYREDHGDEAAKVLEEQYGEIQKMRDAENQRTMEEEYEKRRAAREAEIQDRANLDKDIASQTELKEWRDNKDPKFQLAIYHDSLLQKDPAWQDKPQTERFAEVVRQVKIHLGQEESGSPTTPTDEAKQTSQKKSAEQAAEEILKEARESAKAKTPTTLTDIPNVTTGKDPASLEGVAEMDGAALFEKMKSGALTSAAIDNMLNEKESEFYIQD